VNPKCQQAVTAAAQAIGRAVPTARQLQAIEDSISARMRELGRPNARPGWQAMSREQRMQEAAASLMADIDREAQRKVDNAARQINAAAATEDRISQIQAANKGKKHRDGTYAEALKGDLRNTGVLVAAERKIAMGNLFRLIEAAGDKHGAGIGKRVLMFAFDAENRTMTRDIVREIFKNADGHSGNQIAQTAARAWLDTVEALRQRFNAAGGDVGRLEYGWVPQPHDTAKIRKAGRDGWVLSTMQWLDRSRYVREDGTRMDDNEVIDFLHHAYDTLSTEGVNKKEPGAFTGSGARANRGSDSRQLHFADGDAWLQYDAAFGRGTLFDAMMGHIGGITRDTTLIERYGPNANATARLQFDLAAKADGTTPGRLVGKFSINPETYWDMLTGKTGAPKDEGLARTFETVRNLQTAAKLGAAVVSSVTDLGTLAITAGYNRLSYWRLLGDIGSQASKQTREFMATHGMIAESLASSLNRWSGDHLGSGWSGKVANSVMKLSLLNAWTDGLRQGFTLSMNAKLAELAGKDWGALTEFDRSRLTRAGFTDADWAVLKGVAPTQFKGRTLLTPQAIKQAGVEGADQLAAKVFGFIHDESEYAVVNPDMATRAIVTHGGQQAGTWGGEIARTVMQFKSFPIAMFTRHWARMLEGNHDAKGAPLVASRTGYAMALMATLTGLGAVATQEKQILQGKDPIDMHKGRFWAKAVAQGGGLAIAGDLFLIDPADNSTDSATTAIKNIAGPALGSAAELVLKDIGENVWQASEGKDTHWQAELASWAKSQTPGASLWWVRPMIDHGFVNAMNENLSPGYLSRMQQRAQKDWGTGYWWAPRDTLPSRAPDLEHAVGG
jgi:hypothetical protein